MSGYSGACPERSRGAATQDEAVRFCSSFRRWLILGGESFFNTPVSGGLFWSSGKSPLPPEKGDFFNNPDE